MEMMDINRMQEMHKTMERIQQSKDPAERQRLMQEHMDQMHKMMSDMQGMMGMQMGDMGDQQLQQLAGPYAQQALTQTIVAFKNTLDWITGDTDLLAVSAKILTEPGLSYGDTAKPNFNEESEDQLKKRDEEMKQARKKTQMWIEISLIVILPLLFAVFGVLRWQLRLRSRENVSLA